MQLEKDCKNKKKGFSSLEISLFAIFLSVVAGTTVFLFFLGSHDVKKANKTYEWLWQVNDKLDEVCEKISNAAEVIHPFSGDSSECYFRAYEDENMAVLSPDEEGFIYKGGRLFHISRPEQNSAKNPLFVDVANPIVESCEDCRFKRLGPNLIELDISISELPNTKASKFRRLIKLRN